MTMKSAIVAATSTLRFWLWLGLVIWMVIFSYQSFRLERAMRRYVLPRRLTDHQKAIIAAELSQSKPQEVHFKIAQADSEAGNYRADIDQALVKGGWPVVGYTYEVGLQEGLSIHTMEPMRSQTPQEQAWNRVRPQPPRPMEILRQAFEKARVQLDGAGSGSGQNTESTTVTVIVGPRRRDKFAVR